MAGLPKVGPARIRGQKVRMDMKLRPDLAQWVERLAQAGGGKWSRVGIVEHCIEQAMQQEEGNRPETIIGTIERILASVERIEAGVDRLRAFASFAIEERYLPPEKRPKSLEEWIAAMEETGDA